MRKIWILFAVLLVGHLVAGSAGGTMKRRTS